MPWWKSNPPASVVVWPPKMTKCPWVIEFLIETLSPVDVLESSLRDVFKSRRKPFYAVDYITTAVSCFEVDRSFGMRLRHCSSLLSRRRQRAPRYTTDCCIKISDVGSIGSPAPARTAISGFLVLWPARRPGTRFHSEIRHVALTAFTGTKVVIKFFRKSYMVYQMARIRNTDVLKWPWRSLLRFAA